MSALASRVDDAISGLPEREQRVLALREREGADYRTIAAQVGGGREGIADLLVSARLGLWAQLHDTAPPPRRTKRCGPARRVLAAQADGEVVSAADADRAREHLAGCGPCTQARVALREAEIACRAWSSNRAPTVPVPTNRAPSVPDDGTQRARLSATGTRGARLAAGRRRLVAAAVGLVLLLAVLAVAFGGDDPAPTPGAPRTGPGSAEASGRDVIPPPGDKFCPAEQPDCK